MTDPAERAAVGSGARAEVIGEIRGARTVHHFERSGGAAIYLGYVVRFDAVDRAARPLRRRLVEGVSYVKEERPRRIAARKIRRGVHALEALAHLTHARPGDLVECRVLEHAIGETAVKEPRRRRRGLVYTADRDGDGIARGVLPAERATVILELYRVNSVGFEVKRESRLRPRVRCIACRYVVVRARGSRSLAFLVALREIADMRPILSIVAIHAIRRRRDVQIAHAVVERRAVRIAVPDRQRQFLVVVLPVRGESRFADRLPERYTRGVRAEPAVAAEIALVDALPAARRELRTVLRHRARNVRRRAVRRHRHRESDRKVSD